MLLLSLEELVLYLLLDEEDTPLDREFEVDEPDRELYVELELLVDTLPEEPLLDEPDLPDVEEEVDVTRPPEPVLDREKYSF